MRQTNKLKNMNLDFNNLIRNTAMPIFETFSVLLKLGGGGPFSGHFFVGSWENA